MALPRGLALGTMMFGSWGNSNVEQCNEMVDIALDHGIALFDTADMYDAGHSEEILGAALAGRREGVYLATKVGLQVGDDPAHSGLSPRWIRQACEDSLRRLQTDHIDLYQMHRPDPTVPIADTLGALQQLIEAGKVGAIGTSTFSVAQLAQARAIGIAVPRTEQPPYSILCRGIENDVLKWCLQHDVQALVWAPLNGGWLTGKYQAGDLDPVGRAALQGDHFDFRDADMRQRKRALVATLVEIAAASGLTIVELALGFVLSHPAVSSAIIGPRTPVQLQDLLAARIAPLSSDILAAIDAVVAPGLTVNPADNG